jgi:hypothetical protein
MNPGDASADPADQRGCGCVWAVVWITALSPVAAVAVIFVSTGMHIMQHHAWMPFFAQHPWRGPLTVWVGGAMLGWVAALLLGCLMALAWGTCRRWATLPLILASLHLGVAFACAWMAT